MNKAQHKKKAQQLEKRFEDLFKQKCATQNNTVKKQLQSRMDLIRELQKHNLQKYYEIKNRVKKK